MIHLPKPETFNATNESVGGIGGFGVFRSISEVDEAVSDTTVCKKDCH